MTNLDKLLKEADQVWQTGFERKLIAIVKRQRGLILDLECDCESEYKRVCYVCEVTADVELIASDKSHTTRPITPNLDDVCDHGLMKTTHCRRCKCDHYARVEGERCRECGDL